MGFGLSIRGRFSLDETDSHLGFCLNLFIDNPCRRSRSTDILPQIRDAAAQPNTLSPNTQSNAQVALVTN
ncbi:hypothetical protein QA646_06860 [Rhizobium sp. CB3090]|uniref:hypothetical protein n=1 Tax=Rhizobium sp. CB3090 TaxID=3039156 RepID=UPI0024B0D0AB|nr:hypothetical protein [Rhizobium sp. CB3090]WFU10562.1 hypothetical protein QA646_06860 [Rhizobium sp. CB3090]